MKKSNSNNSTATGAIPATIGERIRALRKKHHMSAQALADSLNVDRSTIYRYEDGTRSVPDEMLDRLADIFRRPKYYLMCGEYNDPTGNFIDLSGLSFYQRNLVKDIVKEFLRQG